MAVIVVAVFVAAVFVAVVIVVAVFAVEAFAVAVFSVIAAIVVITVFGEGKSQREKWVILWKEMPLHELVQGISFLVCMGN
ncbi:Uncharacterised protein [Bacillus freudenreichii]|nr:Uncharacterised protein [Bacillus freudenreichii]